jgi:trehalose-6-phosphate synthase
MNRRQIRKVAVVVAHPNDETLWVGGTLLMEREPHEEVFRAVFDLWRTGTIVSKSLGLFAYEDGHGSYLPRASQCSPQDSSIFCDAEEHGCVAVFLSQEEVIAFYEGFSNSSIWPLLHYLPNYLALRTCLVGLLPERQPDLR